MRMAISDHPTAKSRERSCELGPLSTGLYGQPSIPDSRKSRTGFGFFLFVMQDRKHLPKL